MAAIGEAFQQGMNFNNNGKGYSVLNMSVRPDAHCPDKWCEDGETIIYIGHDARGELNLPSTMKSNQPIGPMCENGKFIRAVEKYEQGQPPRIVKVYEKIQPGVWAYNGFFELVGYDYVEDDVKNAMETVDVEHARLIPSAIKAEVYKRDKGACRMCGAKVNLHYDHILPYSKGGTSTDSKNIQILCAKCNLEKGAKII